MAKKGNQPQQPPVPADILTTMLTEGLNIEENMKYVKLGYDLAVKSYNLNLLMLQELKITNNILRNTHDEVSTTE